MFTTEETTFLLNVLGTITIKPLQSDAISTITVMQSIFNKLTEEKKDESNP